MGRSSKPADTPEPGPDNQDEAPEQEERGKKGSTRQRPKRKRQQAGGPLPRPFPRHPTVRQMARAALLERTRIQQQLIRSAKDQVPLPLEFVEDPRTRRRRRGADLTREELLARLLEPLLTLGDTAKILDVHPSTVRRYSNKGVLPHVRTPGNQRRFRLSDVLRFLADRDKILELYRLGREPHAEAPGDLLEEEER